MYVFCVGVFMCGCMCHTVGRKKVIWDIKVMQGCRATHMDTHKLSAPISLTVSFVNLFFTIFRTFLT